MAIMKHRKNKNQPKLKKNSLKQLEKKTWEKVKIKGKVISDDGGGFEGLIGLEVLENYSPSMVETGTAKQTKLERKDAKEKNKQLKESKSNKEVASKAAKPEKTIALKKQTKNIDKKQTKKNLIKKKTKPLTENKDYPPERFSFLRPPTLGDNNDDEAPELVPAPSSLLGVDELEGWNGLGVPDIILKALAENGFKSPTQIQALTLPAAILGKKDILGAAETGSGKTLAFGIPILTGILELKEKKLPTGIRKSSHIHNKPEPVLQKRPKLQENRELTPPPEELAFVPELPTEDEASDHDEAELSRTQKPLYAVILTPTRELAMQVKNHLVAAAKYTGIRIAAIFGGLSSEKQQRLLKQCPEIVVATPGRLWELYQQENPHLSKIDDISFLVIDETDRMVEKGHFEELRSLLKVLNADEDKKRTRQNFVFSATLSLVHDLPEHLQKRNFGKHSKFVKPTPGLKIQNLIEELNFGTQPKVVDITRSQQTAQTLMESRLMCSIDHKDYYLYYFLQRYTGRTIVFCNSIDCVKRLATLFGLLQCNPLPLHAQMIQKQRLKNLERFRDNHNGLLIATDVAARGLDIPNVNHVIHYQVPRTSENYVHRSGRTARASKDGITVMFMEPGEVKSYLKLYKTLDRTEDLPLFPVAESFLGPVKERVNLARDVDKEELKLRRTQSEVGWMKKTAEEMDIIIDGYNDESGSDQDEDAYTIERRRNRNRLESLRANLKALLTKPIFPKGFSYKYPTSTSHLSLLDNNLDAGQEEANSAIKVMQKAIEDTKLEKKMRNKKRKHS